MAQNLDWKNLDFSYRRVNCSFVMHYRDGKWEEGKLVEENTLTISNGSACLHYGQQCFEGLKAYRNEKNEIVLFRPDENAKRLQESAKRLMMPVIPVEVFIDAVKQVVKANEEFVPPYGTGATLYLRPLYIGVGDMVGVKPAKDYIFTVFCTPVGAYFKGGMKPVSFITTEYDRAAPMGTGGIKVGGNYAGSLLPHAEAVEKGYADAIYLDPATHTKIEEVGAANFFGITKDNVFVTPKSPSILPSITKRSLLYLAEHYLNMKVEERDCYIDQIDEFVEAGACGTAAVISPIKSIVHNGKETVFCEGDTVGPKVTELYNLLTGIQFGQKEGPEGWIVKL